MRSVEFDGTFDGWRSQARFLLEEDVSPAEVHWGAGVFEAGLFESGGRTSQDGGFAVPKEFAEAASLVACHRDENRWNLLYRMVYRLTHGERFLLRIESDPDVYAFHVMERAVRRDMHKMHAFVRFRKIGDQFVAWHRPDHHIVEANAGFFVRRFGSMTWAILTPEKSVYWDTRELRFGPGLPRSAAPAADELESLWNAYYASIFNPARVKIKAMKTEMPVRHWATMPETAQIPELLRNAEARVARMQAFQPRSAREFVPPGAVLDVLREAVKTCRGCSLCEPATQAVFGEGPASARVVLIGEQPGDQEDLAGRPFVGPAGEVLNRALAEAGLDRGRLYLTNAVKHFKFSERGKRRIHEKPSGVEIAACRPWVEAEMAAIRPDLLVCLGATAAQTVLGRTVKVMEERGRLLAHHWAPSALITVHPSLLLRIPDEARRAEEYRLFVNDLRQVAEHLKAKEAA